MSDEWGEVSRILRETLGDKLSPTPFEKLEPPEAPEPRVEPARSSSPLDSCRAKLNRAKHHLDALDDSIAKWLGHPDTYRVTDKVDAESGYNNIRIKLFRNPLPEWQVAIGDFLQCLRNALDHLVFALAEIAQGTPLVGDPARDSMFPVGRTKPPTAKGLRQQIGMIDPGAQAFIAGLQRYVGSTPDPTDRIWQLNELANIDKHRVLHVTAFALGQVIMELHRPLDYMYLDRVGGSYEELTVGNAVSLSTYRAIRRHKRVKMELNLTVDVAFESGTPICGGQVVVIYLRSLYDEMCSRVVDPLIQDWGNGL